jgi:hypothetical protein
MGELGEHHVFAAPGTIQCGLVDHGPERGRVGAIEDLLPFHADVQFLLHVDDAAGDETGSRVVGSLEETRHESAVPHLDDQGSELLAEVLSQPVGVVPEAREEDEQLEQPAGVPVNVELLRVLLAERRTTEAALRSSGVPALVDDTLIVVNELGTNAAKAAPGDWMELGLRLLPEGVMVELWDSSSDLPPDAGPDDLDLLDLNAEGGRGLLVVSAYSAKRGVIQAADRQGKTVWALCAHGESGA